MNAKVIGAFEAKTHLSQLLDEVEKGVEIGITRRGRLVARLVPPEVSQGGRELEALVERVREERGTFGIRLDDIAAWKSEGRA
jgi:prevent-host-death family protein